MWHYRHNSSGFKYHTHILFLMTESLSQSTLDSPKTIKLLSKLMISRSAVQILMQSVSLYSSYMFRNRGEKKILPWEYRVGRYFFKNYQKEIIEEWPHFPAAITACISHSPGTWDALEPRNFTCKWVKASTSFQRVTAIWHFGKQITN